MPQSMHRRRLALEAKARRQLLEQRRRLSEALGYAEKDARELYEMREPDWEDQAANVAAAAGLDRIGDRERTQFAQVRAALERLDDGTWGRCLICGQPIAEQRLRAVPEATRCPRHALPAETGVR